MFLLKNLQNLLHMTSSDKSAEHSSKFVWISSFPKSGNTWFRSFLSALLTGEVDINKLESDGHYSSIPLYNRLLDMDFRMMTTDEMFNIIPDALRYFASQAKDLQFFKTHDAFRHNTQGHAVFPPDVTHKVVYLVRNPLDVVASYANHMGTTKDIALAHMNNPQGSLVGVSNKGVNITMQLYQLMYDWSGHVRSWLDQKELDVILVRYEDMKSDPLVTFSKIVKELGFNHTEENIKSAIELTKFEKLKAQEDDKGFSEKARKSERFFRKGKVGGYTEELTEDQIQSILNHHGEVMERLGYV